MLPAVHSTRPGKQLHSNKQEYLVVKKPWAVVLLGVCALSHDDFSEIGVRNGKRWQGAAQSILEISWNTT